jgi:hypothetical protein
LSLLAAASWAALSASAWQPTPPATDADRFALIAYPGAREFCAGHVMGPPAAGRPGPSILWAAYATPDLPAKVVDHFHRALGREPHRREDRRDTWRLPTDRPERVVDVAAVADAVLEPSCQRPPASTATVIVMSTMVRPR